MSKSKEPYPLCFEPRYETHRLILCQSFPHQTLPIVDFMLDHDPVYYLSKTERLFYVQNPRDEKQMDIYPLDGLALRFEKRDEPKT